MSLELLVEELKKDLERMTLQKFKKLKTIVKGKLYNIHKRSLPVGVDKPVAFGMSERDATTLSKILTRQIQKDNQHSDVKHYFDIIRQESQEDLNVYYSNKELLK